MEPKPNPNPNGGQECPPSEGTFFDPSSEVEKRAHRLPHWQQGTAYCFVTWRLADSLPKVKLDAWRVERKIWLGVHPEPWDEKTKAEYEDRFTRKIEDWLDQGFGTCLLRHTENSAIVANAIRHFDEDRYFVTSFVIMPNHVHVLFHLGGPNQLDKIVKSWKGFTARRINERLGATGSLWQEDYLVRLIRNSDHFAGCVEYIKNNPVRAGLATGDYRYYKASEGGFSNPPLID